LRRIRIAERPDWRERARELGFRFHSPGGEPYWDESAYYGFTLAQVEQDLEDPTLALHRLALALVEEVVQSDALLERLAIPAPFRAWIRESWEAREPHLYGRIDLAYDGRGPAKLYEFNYDTPTSLYEAAFFQWVWMEEQVARGLLPADADQFNSLQEHLIEAFSYLAPGLEGALHFAAVRDSEEDQGTIAYLRDCAHQAGMETRLVAIEDIGLTADGRFTDLDDRIITSLFKLYPIEYLMQEAFGTALPAAGLRLIEPPWKAVISNKGFLPLLWERHPQHPNLLEARFVDDPARPTPPGWVRKPFFSREGSNITLALPDGTRVTSDGPDAGGPWIEQRYHPLPVFEGHHALVGSWVIAGRAVGIGMREDRGPITQDTSRFVPHVILPD
jgi:glutathionylspermidine synthase